MKDCGPTHQKRHVIFRKTTCDRSAREIPSTLLTLTSTEACKYVSIERFNGASRRTFTVNFVTLLGFWDSLALLVTFGYLRWSSDYHQIYFVIKKVQWV